MALVRVTGFVHLGRDGVSSDASECRADVAQLAAQLPMRLVIVDQRTALVPIDPAGPRAGALEISTPGVVAGLIALFEQIWASGRPFGEVAARDQDGLTTQERGLIELLAEGHTDESAGRKLAISTRSVQRTMMVLTRRLGVSSRFQAGVEATRQGWVRG
ncbi:helix-turn-helix transcriptional regulator [Actinoplanes hulinensis]|uniref:Helix-turn-helix transcriptional regulator n=2 Tax=Actinoplanes hulinensis TaxID=1144547 RepID=A0ABS7BDG5_9ACTN|nr:helix-turn-helix transcriptional regulator [Actinoplanes hulinensis]